jgi:hypothetical protein
VQVSESLGVEHHDVDRLIKYVSLNLIYNRCHSVCFTASKTSHVCSREKASVLEFFNAAGPQTLLVSYQVPEEQTPEGEWVKRGTNPTLHIANKLSHRLHGKAVYFFHSSQKGVAEKVAADEIQQGVIRGDALTALRSLVNDFFGPMLRKQEKWGRLTPDLQAELLKRVSTFGAALAEAAESLANSVELTKPDAKYMSSPMNLATFKELADKVDASKDFQACLQAWISKVRPVTQ